MSIAEVNGVLGGRVFHRADTDRVAHGALGLEGPVDAAGLGVDRIYIADIAPDEDAAGSHGGLAERGDAGGKSKGPLEFQLRHIGGGQPSVLGALEARVG